MANVDRPSGATPVGTISGSPWNAAVRPYSVDSSNATAIFVGDFVTLEADGNCTPAAAGGVILGVCVGIKKIAEDEFGVSGYHTAPNLDIRYLPASTAGTILVSVGNDILYEVQEDSVGSNLALTDVGANIDLIAGAGSTTTGNSAHELDSSTVTAAGSAQLRIIGKVNRPDNAVGTNCRWIVRVHESHLAATNGI